MNRSLKIWLIAAVIIIAGFAVLLVANLDKEDFISPREALSTLATCEAANPNAVVTIQEFSDFQCPACKQRHDLLLMPLKEKLGDKLEIDYKHFPLSIHPNAPIAAATAEAARIEGKFDEMHDLLFERQGDWAYLSQQDAFTTMLDYGEELGFGREKFQAQIQSDQVLSVVKQNAKKDLL